MPKRGAQPNNQNARRTHPRLAVSFSGTTLDLVYEKLAREGCPDPTPEQVKAFIRRLVALSVKATS